MARVRCVICGREQNVDGAHALNHGWPTCHGQTMRLLRIDDAEIERGVAQAFEPAHEAEEATRRG